MRNNQSSRLPSLEGWRAISIAVVLVAHSFSLAGCPAALQWVAVNLIDYGNLGVRFFFLISGFLITWLLIVEYDQTGQVSLKHFYARRVLRIFPVYFAFLFVLMLLQLFTPYQQNAITWIGNLTFTTNFIEDAASSRSGHLWSLAVEEQFYFVWPTIFLLAGVASRLRRAWGILSIPILTAPIFRIIGDKHLYPSILAPFFNFCPTFNFYDSIAIGCLCAILFARRHLWVQRNFERWSTPLIVGGIILILAPDIFSKLHLPGQCLHYSFQAAGFAILLLHSITAPQCGVWRVLNSKGVCHIGVLSYSIYIWQQLFCAPETFGLSHHIWWMSFPGWLLAVLVAAHISYFCLERPLFRLRACFRNVPLGMKTEGADDARVEQNEKQAAQ